MYRRGVHDRKGTPMFSISAIDCALWDLRGKVMGQPVHVCSAVRPAPSCPPTPPCSGSRWNRTRSKPARKEYAAKGYTAQKWFPRWGPSDGREGIRKNVALMENLRAAAGPESDIMIDAWMSWDVPYTLDMAQRLKPYDPALDRGAGAARQDQAICRDPATNRSCPSHGGEHEYTRWGIKELLDARAVDLMQADTYWAGGISEMVKICHLCAAYDIPIMPHGHSVPSNVQLSAALSPVEVPYVEFLVKWNQILQHFFKDPVLPENGVVKVRPAPAWASKSTRPRSTRNASSRSTNNLFRKPLAGAGSDIRLIRPLRFRRCAQPTVMPKSNW